MQGMDAEARVRNIISRRGLLKGVGHTLGGTALLSSALQGQEAWDLEPGQRRRPVPPSTPNVAIFSGGTPGTTTMQQILISVSQGSYTTLVLWDVHLESDGTMGLNGATIASDGAFPESLSGWASSVRALKHFSTITRIELSFGAAAFEVIKSLNQQYGNGPSNPLHRNLKVLKKELSLDAVDYDDEITYDLASSTALAKMCVRLGMRVSICPYQNEQYWAQLVNDINSEIPRTVDAVYVQCYNGGAANTPAEWNGYLKGTGLIATPGFWTTHPSKEGGCTSIDARSAQEVRTQVAAWAQTSQLAGAFIFTGGTISSCPGGGTAADYATAIRVGLTANPTQRQGLG